MHAAPLVPLSGRGPLQWWAVRATRRRLVRAWLWTLAVAAGSTALALPATAQPAGPQAAAPATASRFMVRADTVCDRRSGLLWQRCALGQRWQPDLGCVGLPSKLHADEALEQAAAHDGGRWRLPATAELQALLGGDDGAGADAQAFPDLPVTWFWTSGPGRLPVPWGQGCGVGGNETCDRSSARAVWLVRNQQPPACLAGVR